MAQDVPEGLATFTVRLTDLAGNTTTCTTTTTVDSVAPVLTLTEQPAARSADATPTFAFQVQGASVVECRINYSLYAPCSSPRTLALGSGNHLHEIRARAAAGNTTTVSTSLVIDLYAPLITFTAAPAANTAVTSTTFAFTVQDSDLQTVECSYDAAPYAPCTSPVTISSLTLGNHSFSVRATDGLGNLGLRTHFFHADPRPINVTFLSGPLGDTADNTHLRRAFYRRECCSRAADLRCAGHRRAPNRSAAVWICHCLPILASGYCWFFNAANNVSLSFSRTRVRNLRKFGSRGAGTTFAKDQDMSLRRSLSRLLSTPTLRSRHGRGARRNGLPVAQSESASKRHLCA